MKTKYQSSFQEQRQKYGLDKSRRTEKLYEGPELKSLECSTVQEIHPTNESYEMSWIEKLVNHIDDEKGSKQEYEMNRNIGKKYIFGGESNDNAHGKNNSIETRKSYSASKYFNKNSETKNILIEDANKESNKLEKYSIDRYRYRENEYDTYGRIKRVNKLRSDEEEGKLKRNYDYKDVKSTMGQSIYEHSKERANSYNPDTKRQNFFYESQGINSTETKNSRAETEIIPSSSSVPISKFIQSEKEYPKVNFSKESKSESLGIESRKSNNSLKLESITSDPLKDYESYKSSMFSKRENYEEKKREQQEDMKMDEMAKRLNMVINNINSKAKISEGEQRSKWDKNDEIYGNKCTSESKEIEGRCPLRENLKTPPKQSQSKSDSQHYSTKYENMKKSLLSISKHIPQEIILEESSSEINSEVSPRTDFLLKELKLIFNSLDKNKMGEINQANCAVEDINDEVRYLLGGVISKIRYRNQKMDLKNWIEECQAITRGFEFHEIENMFQRQKNTNNLKEPKLNFKDTESHRWNTNNESETKRSSDRSEVVKRYEFADDQRKNLLSVDEITIEENLKREKEYQKVSALKIEENKVLIKNENIPHFSTSHMKTQSAHLAIGMAEKGEKENHCKPIVSQQKGGQYFEKMCESLNARLNKYLTSMTRKEPVGPKITLEFSELTKHLGSGR